MKFNDNLTILSNEQTDSDNRYLVLTSELAILITEEIINRNQFLPYEYCLKSLKASIPSEQVFLLYGISDEDKKNVFFEIWSDKFTAKLGVPISPEALEEYMIHAKKKIVQNFLISS